MKLLVHVSVLCACLVPFSRVCSAESEQSGGMVSAQQSLVQENQSLRERLGSLASKTKEVYAGLKAERESMQEQLESLRAKLAVLEAQPAPLTAEEQVLFRNPNPALLIVPSKLPAALIAQAQQLFTRREYVEAEAKYLEILKLDERNVCTLGNLATIAIEQNKLEEANRYVTTALAIEPRDAFSLGVLGNLRFREGKYDLALAALSRAAQINPNDSSIQNFLGVTLSRLGQPRAAEAALRKAIQLDPEYGSAHNNLAVIYVTQQPPQKELARWHYQKALFAGQSHNEELEKLLDDQKQPPADPAAKP